MFLLRILILIVFCHGCWALINPIYSVRQQLFPRCASSATSLFASSFRRRSPSSSSSSDLSERLNFQQIVKINPSLQTPISELNCSSITKNTLLKKGFTALTPIQSQSYDYIIAGDDIIGRSRTGTGKTLAFGLPIIERLITNPAVLRRQKEQRGAVGASGMRERRSSGPTRLPLVLILEPTRELALQVAQELATVGAPHQLRVSCIYGGASFMKQEEELRYQGADIVVATPGRLLDHLQQRTIDLASIGHVILDEGDTMLEMGFQEDVEAILDAVTAASSAVKRRRQSKEEEEDDEDLDNEDNEVHKKSKDVQMLLFSATMPSWIVSMTNRLMKEPTFLDAIQEGETRLAATIKHFSILLPETAPASSSASYGRRGRTTDRVEQVGSFIEDIILTRTTPSETEAETEAEAEEGGDASDSDDVIVKAPSRRGQQTIIFTNTKEEADRLLSMNCFQYFTSQVLHGDISQYMRQKTLSAFRNQYLDILISTDVAARGLDIQGVDLVIHLYPPKDVDSYVHRSGRTGRAGRNGTAIVFHNKAEQGLMNLLQKKLKFSFQSLGLPLPQEITKACAKIVDRKLSDVEEETVQHFLPHARHLLARYEAKQVEKEVLFAKCMAAISQRTSITVRSLVTGREGFLTLAFAGPFVSRNQPEIWSKFLLYYLGKTLAIDRFRTSYAKLPSTILFALNASQPLLLVDFEEELAAQILAQAKHLHFPDDVTVQPCTALPEYVQWQQPSYDTPSSSSSSSYSRGRDRDRGSYRGGGDRGGDRDRDRPYRSSSSSSGGGWRGGGGVDRGRGEGRGRGGGEGGEERRWRSSSSEGPRGGDRGGGMRRTSYLSSSGEGRGGGGGGDRSVRR